MISPTKQGPLHAQSLRRSLLLGILIPVALFIVIDTVSLYRQTLTTVNTAYDRTLLASAKSIAELLDVDGYDATAQLRAAVPYSALEAFEADNHSRIYYKVSSLSGEMVSGFADLPAWRGQIPAQPVYAALVDFYNDDFRGEKVRVATLLQPVVSVNGRAMAMVQVAETLELRETGARRVLIDTLWRQALLVVVVVLVTLLVVQRTTRPIRQFSAQVQRRDADDLSPLAAPGLSSELVPLVQAINQLMERQLQLLDHQKRFVRDASHQLRTPLAVLQVQVQSALQGDVPPRQALEEIRQTVERATALANQMLALAKVEQLRHQTDPQPQAFDTILRDVALDVAPLVADKELDFELTAASASVRAHDWMLRELCRNLLHNAIRHTPRGGLLHIRLAAADAHAVLTVSDAGPGISEDLRQRLFQPFSAGDVRHGSGLGLAICREITTVLHGSMSLVNRPEGGLDAVTRLPLATPAAA